MRTLLAPQALLLALLPSCGSDITVTQKSVCDGQAQGSEEYVDAPFDEDGDGYYDHANADCAAHYSADYLDCDDSNAEVNPNRIEVSCNFVDDDCDEATLDGEDGDGDGWNECEDCEDDDDTINPTADEIACSGIDEDCDEGTPDSEDIDADGWSSCDDCDDLHAEVNPDMTEAPCNDLDDDCNADTPDSEDYDGDGWESCTDCDDLVSEIHPDGEEVCDNGYDDNCNGETDENCVSDYNGTWDLDTTPSYTCAWGNVTIDFDQVLVNDTNPTIEFSAVGSGIQPSTMSGTIDTSNAFETDQVLTGTCNEIYEFDGQFTSWYSFTATFSATYTGSYCLDCTSQSWTVNGSR